jgi:hypothetical protein
MAAGARESAPAGCAMAERLRLVDDDRDFRALMRDYLAAD